MTQHGWNAVMPIQRFARGVFLTKAHEIRLNRHRALVSRLGMIFSENRFALFRIMP
ncbi:hypothetical protein [Bradyrhizobium sp. CER78]|uniref:hypothetical protein n=1 Tax=Bradyrhizobium sp. CER78 TaxID=3039162 RepID=UPI00244BC5BD|nr:hypothetical protein [Bradyrhizobium sp. CER78]MDH2382331.1 hypothetical protein [Bradyrhizobium sp. CER78]